MTRHTVTEAAQLVDRSARTLYKWIRAGYLSAQRSPSGALLLDTSELVRAFGEIHDTDSRADVPRHDEARQLQERINHLEQMLHERERVNSLLRDQNEHLMRLLEDKSSKKTALSSLTDALADRIRGR